MLEPESAPPPATTLPQASERIPELDGLRGIAVLQVVAWHYLDVWGSPWCAPFRLGWSGVDMFFVLSGFLIGGILLDNRARPRYFQPFYGRRIHRIFPLYYAWLALVLLARMPADAPRWSYLLFAQNIFQGTHPAWDTVWIGHTWSLAIEEQFYLIAPLLIRFLPARALPWFGFGILAGAPVCRWLMPAGWPLAANMMTPCRADALVWGVLVAALIRQPAARLWLIAHRRLTWTAAALACIPMLYLLLNFKSQQSMHPMWYSAIAICYACVLLSCVVQPAAPVSRLLRTRLLQKAGALSFAVYIFHLPLFAAAQNLAGNRGIAVLVAGAATWALAAFSQEYLEGPLLRRGRRKYRYV